MLAGTNPNCPTTVLNWSHGYMNLLPNGSIVFTPVGDGYQQIEDPCAARSNFIEPYNLTELYQSWQVFSDPTEGPKLHMFAYDGSPVVPMRLLSSTPDMLPNQMLHSPTTTTVLKRSTTNVAPSIRWWNVVASTTIGVMLGSVYLL